MAGLNSIRKINNISNIEDDKAVENDIYQILIKNLSLLSRSVLTLRRVDLTTATVKANLTILSHHMITTTHLTVYRNLGKLRSGLQTLNSELFVHYPTPDIRRRIKGSTQSLTRRRHRTQGTACTINTDRVLSVTGSIVRSSRLIRFWFLPPFPL